jgi:phenylacetate-CoA ligase
MELATTLKRKKFWINDFLHGGDMWRAFREIRFIYENPEKGEVIRQKRLQELIKFAKQNVPFYQKLEGKLESLSDFPVMNKQTYLQHYADFLTPKELIPGQKGELHIQRTSGSTGTPFEVPQDTRCRTRRIAAIKFGNELVGFHSFEPMVHLRSMKQYYSGDPSVINKDLNITYADNANLNDKKIKDIIDVINSTKAKVVRGYTTPIDIICSYAISHHLPFVIHPTFITGGEGLLESLRKKIINDLHCNVVSQYANEENGVFGQTELNGKGTTMILNRASCFIEILKFDSDEPAVAGELGRVVVTDFSNYAFPMIRYDIGDVASLGEVRNGILMSIDNLAGRKSDLVYDTNGKLLDMANSISPEIHNNLKIQQWQFIQDKEKEYTLRLVSADADVRQNPVHFEHLMQELLGQDAIVHIEYPDELPVLSSGKRKIVICKLNKG